MGAAKVGLRLAGSLGLVALGFGLGSILNRRSPSAVAVSSDDARLRAVVAHERSLGNGVVEANVTAGTPAAIDLSKGTFAVFASVPGPSVDRVFLDGGSRTGAVTLSRPQKDSLPNVGLDSRWQGRLTVRLTGVPSAHLAFFSAAPPPPKSPDQAHP